MAGSASSNKVIWAALLGNTAIALTKFAAAVVTGSSAMFSEGVHSVVDTGNQVLLLMGNSRAQRPADAAHPFGRGKEIYFWGFVVAILLFTGGAAVSVMEGLHRLRHPQPVEHTVVNFIVLGVALVFEAGAWVVAYRELGETRGRKSLWRAVHTSKDPGLFVVLFEDTAAITGLAVAAIGLGVSSVTGNPAFDAGSSVVIGVVLGLTALFLALETKSLLLGESAEPGTVDGLRGLLTGDSRVVSVSQVLTMHMGPRQVLVNIRAEFDPGLSAREVETAVAQIKVRMQGRYPEIKRIFIEAGIPAKRGES